MKVVNVWCPCCQEKWLKVLLIGEFWIIVQCTKCQKKFKMDKEKYLGEVIDME